MAYPKIKMKSGEFTFAPEFVRELGKQLPEQLRNMTFTEMIELWKAIKEIGESAIIGNLIKLFKERGSGTK